MPASRSALVLGGASWNTMLYLDRLPGAAPQTVFAHRMHRALGSSGAGKAMNLRLLGAEVTLWALLGDDDSGRLVRRALTAGGVRLIEQIDPLGTMEHVNLMDAVGDRVSIFANPGSLSADVDVRPVEAHVGADLVAVTIVDHCRAFLPMLRERGIAPWIDIHDYDGANPYHAEFIEAAGHLFMSSVGHPGWRGFLERRVAAGTEVAVATHGAAGASGLTTAAGWVEVAAVPVPAVVDTNGAGDAFFAGFAMSWLEHRDLAAAMHAGAQRGAAAVRSPELWPV